MIFNNYLSIEDEEKERSNRIKNLLILFGVILFFFIQHYSFDKTVLKHVNMEPFSEPIQTNLSNQKAFKIKTAIGEAHIVPIAEYKIYGRVYDKHFRPAKMQWAAVYPYDISIGFGNLQHEEVYRAINVKMAGMVSYWSASGKNVENHLLKYFANESAVTHCFTNNHICPANKNVRRGISKLKKKDVVYIEGYLIKFEHKRKDGKLEKGISSTSRNDRENSFRGDNGYGSCEQIYVTRVVSRHGDFR